MDFTYQPVEQYRATMALLLSLSGVCVLNQFPSIIMLGMKGFLVSASGAILGHHGPLVLISDPNIEFKGSLEPPQ